MVGVKEANLVLILVTLTAFAAEEDSAYVLYDRPYDMFFGLEGRKLPDLLDRQASLSAIRSLVDNLERRVIKRTPYGGPCLGAGMSHNCEFGDLKEALKHVEQISSGHFPGRRKRAPFVENQRD